MISKIKAFFTTHLADSSADQPSNEPDRVRIATAALLVEIMITDQFISPAEEAAIARLLENSFGLSESEALELFELAKQEVSEATSLYQFTGLVNDHFSAEEKFRLLSKAWQVALADGSLDKYEENLLRRLADLLHIGHGQFIKAKHIAKTALEKVPETNPEKQI